MKVNVLFFGATADTAGQRTFEAEVPSGSNAEQAFDAVFGQFPQLEEKHGRKHLHLSVNREYSNGSEIINENDELAVFTAVSGG